MGVQDKFVRGQRRTLALGYKRVWLFRVFFNRVEQKAMVSLQEFLNNTTWNPILDEHEEPTKKVLHLRIRVKADSTVDNLKVTLCGHDLRVDFENKSPNEASIRTNAVKRSFCLSR